MGDRDEHEPLSVMARRVWDFVPSGQLDVSAVPRMLLT